MRISDWSSDVCSSDLLGHDPALAASLRADDWQTVAALADADDARALGCGWRLGPDGPVEASSIALHSVIPAKAGISPVVSSQDEGPEYRVEDIDEERKGCV